MPLSMDGVAMSKVPPDRWRPLAGPANCLLTKRQKERQDFFQFFFKKNIAQRHCANAHAHVNPQVVEGS